MDPLILWQHKWSGDLFIPAYLFLGGLTAGLFVVAVLADLVGIAVPRVKPLSRAAALCAVPALALAGFFLTVHLGKPERGLGFPLFFTNYNSWMTRGGWVVGAGAPLVVTYAALWYFGVLPVLRRVVGVVGIPVVGFLAVYTGFLLSGAGYVPLWSRQFLPLLFLSSGMTGGVAAAGLAFLAFGREAGPARPWVRRGLAVVLVALIGLELYEIREFVLYLDRGAPDKAFEDTLPTGRFADPMGSRLAALYLTGGPDYPHRLFEAGPPPAPEPGPLGRTLAPWFWLGIIGLGLLVPLALTVVELGLDAIGPGGAAWIAGLKFVCVLVGGFLLRVVIVWGGDLKAPLPFPPSVWPVPGGGLPPGLGG